MSNWFQDEWGEVTDNFSDPKSFIKNYVNKHAGDGKRSNFYINEWANTVDEYGALANGPLPNGMTPEKAYAMKEKAKTNRLEFDILKEHPNFYSSEYTNADRYNIAEKYLDKEVDSSAVKPSRKISDFAAKPYTPGPFEPKSDKMVRLNEPGRPNRHTKTDSLKQKGKELYGTFAKTALDFMKKVGGELPNNNRDVITASAIGVQFKPKLSDRMQNVPGYDKVSGISNPILDKITSVTDSLNQEKQGFNPISGQQINIDYLSDRVDKQFRFKENREPKNQESNASKKTGPLTDLDRLSTAIPEKSILAGIANKPIEKLAERNLEKWKEMHRQETAKYVRKHGANIDPFSKTATMHNNGEFKELRAREAKQLADVEKRIADANNNVKKFFHPIDKAELNMLERTKAELNERIRRIDSGYDPDKMHTNAIELPKSVGESFADLRKRQAELTDLISSRQKATLYNERSNLMSQEELKDINKKLAEHTNMYSSFDLTDSQSLERMKHTKTFTPKYGLTGYGLGFSNAMAASRTEHLARGLQYLNPFAAGLTSPTQAIMESFGIMNGAQRMQARNARGLGKLGSAAVPGLALGQLAFGMYSGDDPGQIFEDMFSVGTSLAGWRVGSAFGGALGKSNSAARFLTMGAGAVTGMAVGYGVGSLLVGGVRDIMSNESEIRSTLKKASTKEMYVGQAQTQQSLTARQASLQKLARSGLNDRGLLLGNEARILATGG